MPIPEKKREPGLARSAARADAARVGGEVAEGIPAVRTGLALTEARVGDPSGPWMTPRHDTTHDDTHASDPDNDQHRRRAPGYQAFNEADGGTLTSSSTSVHRGTRPDTASHPASLVAAKRRVARFRASTARRLPELSRPISRRSSRLGTDESSVCTTAAAYATGSGSTPTPASCSSSRTAARLSMDIYDAIEDPLIKVEKAEAEP